MKKRVIIEDISVLPEVRKYLHERFNEGTFIEFDLADSEVSLDEKLHEFIQKYIYPEQPNIILLPCSLGDYHTDYLGIRLGIHIRLTRSFENLRFVPIVFFSPDDLQDILKFYPIGSFVGTPGTYLVKDDLPEIEHLFFKSLPAIDTKTFEKVLEMMHFDPPGNYYSEHSVANEWGSFRLDNIAEVNVLNHSEFPGMYSLFFKWLDSKYNNVLDLSRPDINIITDEVYTLKHSITGITTVELDATQNEILQRNLSMKSKKRNK